MLRFSMLSKQTKKTSYDYSQPPWLHFMIFFSSNILYSLWSYVSFCVKAIKFHQFIHYNPADKRWEESSTNTKNPKSHEILLASESAPRAPNILQLCLVYKQEVLKISIFSIWQPISYIRFIESIHILRAINIWDVLLVVFLGIFSNSTGEIYIDQLTLPLEPVENTDIKIQIWKLRS